MEKLIKRIFFRNWQQKVVAFLTALVVWLLVSNSITTTRVITGVPVRVINVPDSKTIEGQLPNGILRKRITLTLSGNKDVIDRLDAGELEVLLDASNKKDEWVASISRKNLVSLNPELDLQRSVASVTTPDFTVKLARLITAKIPITISSPMGEPPAGYQFLDIWPDQLFHTVSGPEDVIGDLQTKGIHLTFDLGRISESDLSKHTTYTDGVINDEVSFPVPNRWKRIVLPFLGEDSVEINDPNAAHLHIAFLRKEVLPIEQDLQITVFYPLKSIKSMNPLISSLEANNLVKEIEGIMVLSTPLYSHHVSRLFLDVTRDNIQITLIALPDQEKLSWSLEFINSPELENEYIRRILAHHHVNFEGEETAEPEDYLRNRFRAYMQQFELYKSNKQPLALECLIKGNAITVQDVSGDND